MPAATNSYSMDRVALMRRLVHNRGYRYRLHRHDLPGRSDLIFAGRKKVVFVHGFSGKATMIQIAQFRIS